MITDFQSELALALSDQIDAITQALVTGEAQDLDDYHRLCGMIEGLRRAADLISVTAESYSSRLEAEQHTIRFN